MMGIKYSTVSPSFSKKSNSCSAAVLKCQAVNNQCCSPFWTAAPPQFWLSIWPSLLWWWLHTLRTDAPLMLICKSSYW